VTSTVVPAMIRTGSKVAVMDCVNLNHCAAVVDAFKKGGIEVFPSAGYPHRVRGGYPPYSHDLSILDAALFRPFQSQLANMYLELNYTDSKTALAAFRDMITPLWESEKYRTMAAKAVEKQRDVLLKIVASGGGTQTCILILIFF